MANSIITAYIEEGKRTAKTEAAWQQDYGMTLKLEGVELPVSYEVDFSNDKVTPAYRVIGDSSGVAIPDELFLTTNPRIYAWVYVHDTEDDGYTVYEVEIPLNQRPGVSGVTPTPEEQDIIEQAIAALNAAQSDLEDYIDEKVDPTLSVADKVADAKSTGDILREYNAADLVKGLWSGTTTTNGGVTFTWANGVCTLSGTAGSSGAYNVLIPFRTAMPSYIVPGKTYAVKFSTTNESGTNYQYRLRVMFYNAQNTQVGSTTYFPVGRSITIPDGAAKWYVSLYVTANVAISGTVTFSDFRIMNTSTNAELQEQITTLDGSLGTLDGEVDAIDGRVDALEANAFRKLTSTEAAAITDLMDMPTGTYYTWYGSALSGMVGEGFPVEIGSSLAYRVKCYPYTNPYKAYTIERTGGSQIIYGSTSVNSSDHITWYDRSLDTLEAHDIVDLAAGNYRRVNATTNDIHYTWDGDKCYVYGTASAFSANVVVSAFDVPEEYIGKPVYVKFRSTDPGVMLRITYNDGTNSHSQYYNWNDRFYTIPEDAVKLSASIYVNPGVTVGSQASPAVVSGIAVVVGKTNIELTDKYNSCDPEKPVYVAIGMSTVIGAVHYYTDSDNDATRYSKYNYPDYTGEVLGLETHNLAIGGTGLICRTINYELQNYMDVIYTNDALLSKASLITINCSTGNDSMLSGFEIGSWDDYYPYDLEGYHPSGGNGSALIALGANWCGCLNWCIRWLGTHYPKAQLILIFSSPSINKDIHVTLTNGNGDENPQTPTKIAVTDGTSQKFKDAHTQFSTLVEKLNLAHIDAMEGLTYTPYAPDIRYENGDWVLWSTIKDGNGVKVRDVHPNDEGYHIMARQVAGQIAELFFR